jgi:hypothetical protein
MTEESKQELAEYKAELDAFNEVSLYIVTQLLIETISEAKKDFAAGVIPDKAAYDNGMEYYSACLDINLAIIAKFGVDPASIKDEENGDLWKWLKHWQTWDDQLTDETRNVIDVKLCENENVDEYLPTKKWNEA